MMEPITRYSPPPVDIMRITIGQPVPDAMRVSESGAWVRHDDAQVQLAETQQEIERLRAELENYRSIAEREGATLAVSALAAMTTDRDLWRLEASAMADDNARLTDVYQAGLRTWEPVYRVQSEKLLQAQQEVIQLRQNAQHDHTVIASLYEELTDLSARPDTRS